MLVMRTWRTLIDPGRSADYDAFAGEISWPMFERHDGFCGLVFAAAAVDERIVVTFWRDRAAADALERSPDYRSVVQEIQATGILRLPQRVELLEVHASSLRDLTGR